MSHTINHEYAVHNSLTNSLSLSRQHIACAEAYGLLKDLFEEDNVEKSGDVSVLRADSSAALPNTYRWYLPTSHNFTSAATSCS